MAQDMYSEVNAIRDDLRAAGEDQWSNALAEAVSYVGLGSEILGEVRLQLRKLRNSDVPQRLNMEKRIDEALEHLDKLLRLS